MIETMTDRCEAAVAIPPSYDAGPTAPGTVILCRDASDRTPWTRPFHVQLGPRGHIRWWCNSTTGNLFDPGTWRLGIDRIGVAASYDEETGETGVTPDVGVEFSTSSWEGWTAERSRCGDRSTLIRARLGPKRLLQIECLGR